MTGDPYRLADDGEGAEVYFSRLADEIEAARARIVELENIIASILNADEGGQGVLFAEAMERAGKAVPHR